MLQSRICRLWKIRQNNYWNKKWWTFCNVWLNSLQTRNDGFFYNIWLNSLQTKTRQILFLQSLTEASSLFPGHFGELSFSVYKRLETGQRTDFHWRFSIRTVVESGSSWQSSVLWSPSAWDITCLSNSHYCTTALELVLQLFTRNESLHPVDDLFGAGNWLFISI